MGDWFETRFTEPAGTGELDPDFSGRMRALVLREWGADTAPAPADHPNTFEDPEGDIVMIETEERPAVKEPDAARRRSPAGWLLVAAAVAVIAVVGALLVTDGDEDDNKVGTVATNPERDGATPTSQGPKPVPDDEEFVALTPGTYFIDPDGDPATPLRVTFDVAESGWVSWLGAAKMVGNDHVAVTITTVSNLTRDACRNHNPREPAVGPTVDDLATALSQLAPFEVSSPARDVSVQGYRGKHLQLRVPNLPVANDRFVGCANGELQTWFSPLHGGGPFYGYNAEPGRTEDFYILDVEGTRLVLMTMAGPKSRPEDVAELEAIFGSIRIEP